MDLWLSNLESEFWKAHNEVMDATGFRKVLDAAATSSASPGALFAGIRDDFMEFYQAVNWSEPFFRYLAAFHVLVWCAVLYSTRGPVSDERLIGICVGVTVAVLAGMLLNSVGSKYAEFLFVEPNVNYFSDDGIFIAAVYMAPLILLIVCLQVRMACRVIKLMVQVKGAQVKRRLRREAKAQEPAAAAAASESKKEQ